MVHFRSTASVIALAALSFATPAWSADGAAGAEDSGEIVVTAQRRAERSLDVPITVASLSAQTLQTANVNDLSDIVKVTPGIRFDFAGGFFQPTIRGIGTAVTTSGGGGNVGIYIDGFYSPNPLAVDSKLMNVQSVQVLKGPQGTLFGRNTTGGAILIQSADPSEQLAAKGKISLGRFNEVSGQAYLTTGVTEGLAFDLEAMYSSGEGYLTNISNGQRVGDFENWAVRAGVKLQVNDDVSVLLRYTHSRVSDPTPLLAASYRDPAFGSGAPWFAAPGEVTFDPRRVASGTDPRDQELFVSEADVFQGTIKADLGFADLTSYSQYRKEKVNSVIELDYSGAGVFELGLPNDNETWSQEFLLNSKAGPRLQWTAGLFAFSNTDTYITNFNFPLPVGVNPFRLGGSSTKTNSIAAYLDITYQLTDQLYLTAGARYAHDSVTDAYYCQPGTGCTVQKPVPKISSDRVTPRVVLRYKPTDQSSIYASYTKGYKAAIIDVGGTCQNVTNPPTPSNPTGAGFTCNPVAPETINAFEVGYKFDNSRLSLEVSGFYYDYKNLQVSQYLAGTAVITNAAKSEIYGLDGQIRYKFSSNFEISAGAAWTHARYKDFVGAPVYTPCTSFTSGPLTCLSLAATGVTFPVIPTNLNNVTMQRTPEFTGNLGAIYKTDLGDAGQLALSGNLFYTSKFFFGPSGIQFPQKGYELLSLRAQWTDPSDRYTLAIWGDNVTDRAYMTQAQYSNFGIGANWGKPATYGVELGFKF